MTARFSEKVERAVTWASSQFEALDFEVVSESQWANVYKLLGPTGASYLKVFFIDASRLASRAIQISDELRGHVPEIISSKCEEGWILYADHGGRTLYKSSLLDWSSVGRCFGSMQANAAKSDQFLSQFDSVNLSCVQQNLMDFLTAPTPSDAAALVNAGAAYFLGEEDASRYAQLLATRARLLADELLSAESLPQTLIHGDLREDNVFLLPDGKIALLGWDEVASGPAGLCIAQLIGGCGLLTSLVVMIASGNVLESRAASALTAYIDALVDGGYATRSVLLSGLIGSACAGQMRLISSFGRYPGKRHRSESADAIRKCLDDLLDVCDFLVLLKGGQIPTSSANDYELCGEWSRARKLLEFQLKADEKQPELLVRSANLSYKIQEPQKALDYALKALSQAPESTTVLLTLARARLGCLDLSGSVDLLTRVLAVEPENSEAHALLARAHCAVASLEQAAVPQNMPSIAISAAEWESNRLETDTLELMVYLFKKYGVIQVDNVFSPKLIEALAEAFTKKYGKFCHEKDYQEAVTIGAKRYMLTVEMDGIFGSAELVASRLLQPFIQKILGSKCILNAFSAVVSLPGSVDQGVHKDHVELFEEREELQEPTFAMQLFVPLIPLDQVVGTTRFFKGSHLNKRRPPSGAPHQDPVVPLGSCYVSDYAVFHAGLGNYSNKVRPLLTLTYSRAWFRDHQNYSSYKKQPPLKFAMEYFESASSDIKSLLAWWNDTERRSTL